MKEIRFPKAVLNYSPRGKEKEDDSGHAREINL